MPADQPRKSVAHERLLGLPAWLLQLWVLGAAPTLGRPESNSCVSLLCSGIFPGLGQPPQLPRYLHQCAGEASGPRRGRHRGSYGAPRQWPSRRSARCDVTWLETRCRRQEASTASSAVLPLLRPQTGQELPAAPLQLQRDPLASAAAAGRLCAPDQATDWPALWCGVEGGRGGSC